MSTANLANEPAATSEVAALSARLVALQSRNELLAEENRWLKQQLFGRSSEKTPAADIHADQGQLFNEAEALVQLAPEPNESAALVTDSASADPRTKRPGRKALARELPRVEIVHDIPEHEKVCAKDGTRLERIGEETSEQLDYQPAQLQVIRHVRPKYACPCCRQGGAVQIQIAPVRQSLIPKSLATAALLAYIVTAKFVDGLPLYRQEVQFARLGVILGRATMAGWMVKLGALIQPLINLLAEQMLTSPLIHCDETRLQVLKSDKAPTSDHWMWVRAAGPPGKRVILFDYDPSRGGQVPRRLLEGYRGVLLTDGYEAYGNTAQSLGVEHAGCWAHARRKFDEAHKAQPATREGHAKTALAFIRELYQIERPLWDRDKRVTTEDRERVRNTLSRPVMERFHAWLTALTPHVLPESQLGKAVKYTLNQWSKLSVFLTHGEVPLDNNRCENAIRPFVLGRKSWLFANTVKGANASANLYSLVESAKANGIEPHAYLTVLFEKLPTATTVEDFEALLPWNVKTVLRPS
jgi:transposase